MNKAEEIVGIITDAYLKYSDERFESYAKHKWNLRGYIFEEQAPLDQDGLVGEFPLADGTTQTAYIDAWGGVWLNDEQNGVWADLPRRSLVFLCNLAHKLCNKVRGYETNRYHLVVEQTVIHDYEVCAKDESEAYDLVVKSIEHDGLNSRFCVGCGEGDWEVLDDIDTEDWCSKADFSLMC